jgi:hypothetical protein
MMYERSCVDPRWLEYFSVELLEFSMELVEFLVEKLVEFSVEMVERWWR